MTDVLLQVDGLVKHYTLPRQRLLAAPPVVQALQGVSFQLRAGRSWGCVRPPRRQGAPRAATG